jgi:hypothetical protein
MNGAAPSEVAHAGVRGAIASMAMTGMRELMRSLGLLEEEPPRAIFRQKARALLRPVPRDQRRAVVELAHWGYGAGGGVAFALLPDALRRQPWAGPAYGLALWAGFEALLAPAMGLAQATQSRPVERAALAADHLLYGLVLSEMRRRPQEAQRA